jgi:hypothetical protein
MSYVVLVGTGVILYFWFDLRKLNVVKVREQYHIKIWKRHAALEILDGSRDIDRKVLERR